MLRHRQAGAGDHKRRGGRNVESLSATRSGPRGVDETTVIGIDPNRSLAHAFRQSGELFNRLASGRLRVGFVWLHYGHAGRISSIIPGSFNHPGVLVVRGHRLSGSMTPGGAIY